MSMPIRVFFLLITIVLCISSCYRKSKPLLPAVSVAVKVTDTPLYQVDDTTRLWLDGKLFYKTVIRVAEGDGGFMFYDIDTIDGVLDSANRESYYKAFRQQLPKDELKAHKIAWEVKELDFQQAGNGGLHTVITWVTDTPTIHEPYYTISVKRIYEDRIGTVIPIPNLQINVKTGKIMVSSPVSGELLTLKQWRKNGCEFEWQK